MSLSVFVYWSVIAVLIFTAWCCTLNRKLSAFWKNIASHPSRWLMNRMYGFTRAMCYIMFLFLAQLLVLGYSGRFRVSVCLCVCVCLEPKRLLLPNHWTKCFQTFSAEGTYDRLVELLIVKLNEIWSGMAVFLWWVVLNQVSLYKGSVVLCVKLGVNVSGHLVYWYPDLTPNQYQNQDGWEVWCVWKQHRADHMPGLLHYLLGMLIIVLRLQTFWILAWEEVLRVISWY